ncbi:hypothetical protein [Bacillus sp. NEB1478]|uniref:hypothetical protein n=1 Tax=Bacillus sp. NEB1478 TaxID=3073816 RepID=UPI002872FC7B|nr:hypothetical protein [Bacillus sp. NEB1478]WNB91867.1 hypothetical protein RGB74_18755 [Bacillus sp. NEB1478]
MSTEKMKMKMRFAAFHPLQIVWRFRSKKVEEVKIRGNGAYLHLREYRRIKTDEEIRSLSSTSNLLLIQKRVGRGSEIFEARSEVNLHEH